MRDNKSVQPFAAFAPPIAKQSPLRKRITAAYRRPEHECLPPLLQEAAFDSAAKAAIAATARRLVQALRAKGKGTGVEGLVQEYALSSQEGVALMCLAEALLRIPDKDTRDALIRDKIAGGNWKSHLGGGRSLFVNAATWGLVMTGKLTGSVDSPGLAASLTRLLARCGEPVIRKGVDLAMRLMGDQFVRGETIDEALKRARPLEERGFRYSYDMLGEAAMTAADAARYYKDYETAIHAIGQAAGDKGVYRGPGISIKLSALHPRYARSQADRVMAELMPRVQALAVLCKRYNIGLNIDAEEADRLELSLDILEGLCLDGALAGWNGIGFVVQAYGRRCPYVIDYLIDLARRSQHRLMVRLVKGAYWDAEIKRAQIDGLQSYPVYTRKVYTDVSYIACAKRLLAAADAVFPQFATHNAQTLASIYHMAGPDYHTEQYEFQCLHGMGEPLYEEVVGSDKLARPARIYAPVGTHETLLAYLVRRLLENGANSSFVHRINDKSVSVDEMIADPVDVVRAMPVPGAQHEAIAAPQDLFAPKRHNSAGYDLSDETELAALTQAFQNSAGIKRRAAPPNRPDGKAETVRNPADHRDIVGEVVVATAADAAKAARHAAKAAAEWAGVTAAKRAAIMERAADLMQQRMPELMALAAREAAKSIPNCIAEVREAIDFLRFYAAEARMSLQAGHKPLGPVVCISPWNFPLAIFTGQVSAALVAGNPVLAKPAEETPLIAAEAVRILHEAGVPPAVLQLLPGDGSVGAALVGAPETAGVMFTGSTEVARLIQAQLAGRLTADGKPVALIAETGGQNAMIVDSSALAEQVVADVISSAFDSAGQRCSALRVLCLQEDIAERTLAMLKGAMHELRLGRTDFIGVDVGPVITAEARDMINTHIETMRAMGHRVEQLPLGPETEHGTFVAPAIIELDSINALKREVFGPVLHVVRYRRQAIDRLIDDINATGYGLTFGLHTRLDDTIRHVTSRVDVGNIYVNRNIIGAVVGSQPFGGRGLSGTGPKAGGPFYIGRLVHIQPAPDLPPAAPGANPALAVLAEWLDKAGHKPAAAYAGGLAARARLGLDIVLPGPVGEENRYRLQPRGRILLVPQTEEGLYRQLAACLATGNSVVIDAGCGLQRCLASLPRSVGKHILWSENWAADCPFAGALIEGEAARVTAVQKKLCQLPGPLVLAQAATLAGMQHGHGAWNLDWLLEELSVSVNTAAAGGNASLMAIG